MTFKLTEKDIAAIEALISDFAGGLPIEDVAAKHGCSHITTVRACVRQLRKLGVEIGERPSGPRPGSIRSEEQRARISAGMKSRWDRLRELESREAAR